jgi:hypothetical protein
MLAWLPGCLFASLVNPQTIWGGVWLGLGVLTIVLVTLLVTRWRQAQPLSKCIVLSVWAHVLMAVYASSVNIVFKPAPPVAEIGIHISDAAGTSSEAGDAGAVTHASGEPWSQFPTQQPRKLAAVALARPTVEAAVTRPVSPAPPARELAPVKPHLPEPQISAPQSKPTETPLAKVKNPAPLDALADEPDANKPVAAHAPAAPAAADSQPAGSSPALATAAPAGIAAEVATRAVQGDPRAASAAVAASSASVAYSLRTSPDRAQIVAEQGGSANTEAAVRAALKWLATHQSPDGRWDASALEAGRETKILGQDRHGAGTEADMGMTGLALLAFLASGHSHLAGDYQPTVRRGLQYLAGHQATDGNLGGRAESFAFMYCHAMAGLALSEACGMTGDRQWLEPVKRAVTYTLSTQNRTTGGWRYRPQDVGDTSQLGWQLMFLKSAGMAGVPMSPDCRNGIERYLQSVASGRHGGLAAYRPGQDPTRSMTAEALVCRLFLGQVTTLANAEAGDYLLGELPGESEVNFYYWYYATLGLYQVHDARWRQWNRAVATELVRRQRNEGATVGSWDPDPVWGSYGGRVYSTALATLCLEVYYRFLPLYIEAAARGRNIK